MSFLDENITITSDIDGYEEYADEETEQAFWQRMALLDEFEDWLYEREFGQDENHYEPGYDDGDELER